MCSEMYDMHCHILWGIDDGAESFTIAQNICKLSGNQGINYIVATPHFIIDEVEQNKEILLRYVNELNHWCSSKEINIKILLGCESYLHPLLPQFINNKRIPTLNNSRYLLVEFPVNILPLYTEEIIYKLMLKGIVPIIAHPEKYSYFRDNPQQLYNLSEKGCKIQCNGGSFLGHFGKSIRDFSFKLLEHNLVHIIGSDSHNDSTKARGVCLKESYEVIKKANLGEITTEVIIDNCRRIISDKELNYTESIPFKETKRKKKSFFKKFF
ncbi:MAG: tyrosine-protein phosphatase [Clostridiaceae bacterium]